MVDRNRVIEEDVVRTPRYTSVASAEHSTTVVPTKRERRLAGLARVQQIIYFVASVFAVIIFLRFVLLLLGANPANGFAHFIYGVSSPLVAPFLSLFGSEPQYGNSMLEISSLVAIAVYYLVAWGIAKIITLTAAPPDPTGQTYK